MSDVRTPEPAAVRPPRPRRRVVALLAAVATTVATLVASPAGAVNAEHATVVSDDPANFTPDVLDGAVLGITQIGGTMYAAGDFTTVSDSGSAATLTRRSLFAFDAATGRVVQSFAPAINGAINSIDTDGTHLYVGGYFSTVNGQIQRRVAKLTTSGALASGQPPFPNSGVNEVVVRGDRLYLGGAFSTVGGQPRAALAAVDTGSGSLLAQVDVPFTGTYNGGGTNVKRFDLSPDGRTLVAVGNFVTVGGLPRQQVAKLDIPATGAATVSGWATDRFDRSRNTCAAVFDTWTRDVDFSPAGDYFVINTTGAFAGGANSGTLCDTTTRWENASSAGQQPTWVNYSGGDTLYGVAVTGTAIYTGGHMRWQNNSFQGDQAGPGAVPREGIAALDPVNGLPFTWNPGRARGVGAQALFANEQGLWVGSDTELFAGERRRRIAFLPLAGGSTPPTVAPATLPNQVYAVQRSAQGGRVLHRVNAGGPLQLSQDDGPDWAADTAASPSPLHNAGSNTATSTISSMDATVPAGTPRDLFTTERWDPSAAPEMQWNLPVPAGRQVQVRLYLANTCDCTRLAGQRVFDVAIEGTTVLDDLDLARTVGHKVGTMRSFPVSSDGTVTVDFRHVVENPLVNAIEVVDPSVPATAGEAPLTRRPVDATGAPTGAATVVSSSADWARARAPFLVGDTLYYGTSAGLFARSFDEGTAGAVREVNLYDDPDDGGRIPFPTGNLTGAFYDTARHRIYYTVANDSRLFYRYFTPESEVVGAQTFVGDNGGLDLSRVAGMTLADGTVLFGSTADGSLRSAPFDGAITGPATVVSADGSWTARGLFVDGPAPAAANQPPTARIVPTCADLTCTFDASTSSDPDGSVTAYAWNFGDGRTGSGASVQHSYSTAGDYTVTLRVTDDDGDTATRQVAVTATAPPANQDPTASFTQTCTELVCSFDGTGSQDPDGSIASYAWDFGDDATGTGATVEHVYATAGNKDVTLTVTDNRGATGTTTATASPTAAEPPPASDIAFRGAGEGTGNARSATAVLPTVQAGDQLLLFLTTNRAATVTGPSGAGDWGAPVQTGSGGRDQLQTWVWARTADGSESGRTVSVGFDSYSKYVLSAVAYSGAVLDSSALAAETVNRAAHTTPSVTVDDAGSWLLSYWADKTSATTDWTSPTGVTDRSELFAPGAGRVTSLLVDSGAAVATGQRGALTATADSSTVKAVTASVVLRPATGAPGQTNTEPTAAFGWTCADLACGFDAGDSGDPDGSITGYAWDFGDGTTATGDAAEHTYPTAGDYTVTLRVTDDRGATGTSTATVSATDAPPAGGQVAFTATASSTANATGGSIRLPSDIQAGDQLLLFLSTNRSTTATDPAGWSRLQRETGDRDQIQGWVWARTATADDAGRELAVPFDVRAKYVMSAAAYRGAAVATSAAAVETVDRPAHTTPSATATTAGSWVVSYWSDKTSETTDWASPSGTSDRAEVVAAGAGRVTSLLVDSGAAAPTGTVGALTATADSSSAKALSFTVVLRPL